MSRSKPISKRFPAFTLLELAVAALLLSLVVSLAYTVLRISNGQLQVFRESKSEVYELSLLDRQLRLDFDDAISAHGSGSTVVLKMSETEEITWRFGDERAVRTYPAGEKVFAFATSDHHFHFHGQVQHLPNGPIDEFSFSGDWQGTAFPFHYQKQYAARELMAFEKEYGDGY